MTAQDIREKSTKIVSVAQYYDLSLVWDGWLLVNQHAWQVLMITPTHPGCYAVQVWNPVRNVIRRAVITAYINVYVTEFDD